MINITEELSNEHQIILKVIDLILSESKKVESGEKPNYDFFREAIDFIKNYADRFHHAKEEDVLFKAMCENEENMHCNPVGQMLYEHDSGRHFVAGMESALAEDNTVELVSNAINYCRLLTDHIYKEDNILYPMAEQGIDNDQKELILRRYKEVELGIVKPEQLEKYLTFYDRFKNRVTY